MTEQTEPKRTARNAQQNLGMFCRGCFGAPDGWLMDVVISYDRKGLPLLTPVVFSMDQAREIARRINEHLGKADGEMTMPSRTYTAAELDALRRAVETKWVWGSYTPHGTQSRCYHPKEKAIAVEQIVRTHMLAGHTAEDLYASEAKAERK